MSIFHGPEREYLPLYRSTIYYLCLEVLAFTTQKNGVGDEILLYISDLRNIKEKKKIEKNHNTKETTLWDFFIMVHVFLFRETDSSGHSNRGVIFRI